AIASCGNAALAAGVIAAAMNRHLEVFVPTWADEPVVERLNDLGAVVTSCPRRPGEAGDPAYLRFREAADQGARPFTVQGTDTPTTFDGGRTLGWELVEQVAGIESVYIQVGGGALATAVSMAMPDTVLYPVQAEGCAPLRRAWENLSPDFDFEHAARHPEDFMWPWDDEPTSAATGILDDVTYDWLPLLGQTRATGGEPLVVPETVIIEAHQLARAKTSIPVSATGSAGLAGLLHHRPTSGRAAVLFTGVQR
ncbi:MAG: PLP-dependent lyase/thiolase, partial [Acidimicrobiia bacterium]|nr:PLP-dependent lyase/thiolase [Acidimicrobiia bacterium]